MKLLRSALAAALVIAAVLSLTACAPKLTDLKGGEPFAMLRSSKSLTYDTLIDQEGSLMLFCNLYGAAPAYYVYDAAADKVILNGSYSTADDTGASFSFVSLGELVFVIKETAADAQITQTELYSSAGNRIAGVSGQTEYYTVLDEYLVFDGVAYGTDDKGSFAKAFDVNSLYPIKGARMSSEKYFYFTSSDGFTVTDKNGETVSTYIYEYDRADLVSEGLLENGNVVLQYAIELPDDASKYDYIKDGVKYDLVTLTVNAKNGSSRERDVDFILELGADSDDVFTKETSDNFAYISRINDGRLSDSGSMVMLNNRLTVTHEFDEDIPGIQYAERVSSDTVLVFDRVGQTHILNSKGRIILTTRASIEYNSAYFWTDDAVYSLTDASKLVDLKAMKMTVHRAASEYLILTKTTDAGIEFHRLYGGVKSIVRGATDVEIFYDYIDELELYVVKNANSYTLYNGAGTAVLTLQSDSGFELDSCVYIDGGYAIAEFDGTYYRLSK